MLIFENKEMNKLFEMGEDELYENFQLEVEKLRNQAKLLNIGDQQINNIFNEAFKEISRHRTKTRCWRIFRLILYLCLAITVVHFIIHNHVAAGSVFLQNIQLLILPVMKLVRFLALPLHYLFPSITDIHTETCLVENPFFYVSNMDCWPCESVFSVLNLSKNDNINLGVPFIYKTKQKKILPIHILQHFKENYETYERSNPRLTSTDGEYKRVTDIKNLLEPSSVHIEWRINQLLSAKTIRKLFPKPDIIPKISGQSIERYVIIDGSNANVYSLPSFDCSYNYLIMASGQRNIILKPSKECAGKCRQISVMLEPGYLLLYNWWYWRPISIPVQNSTTGSISYISSFC